jgi:uridine phosphorylase
VADNIVTGEKFVAGSGHNDAIRVALRGFAILHQLDEEKKSAGQSFWTPSLRAENTPGGKHSIG